MGPLKLLAVGGAAGVLAIGLAPPISSALSATVPAAGSAHSPYAGNRTLDPRHLPTSMPRGVFRASTSGAALQTTSSTNGLLNSDLAFYISDGSTFTSLAAEGHLSLTSNDGGVHYVGTFVDDLSGASVFWASATGIQPTGLNGNYTIDTGNGRMRFSIGGSFTSTVPAKYGSGAKIGTILYGAHAWTAHPPLSATLASFTVGGFHPTVTGTLTLTTDAIGYIVPFFGPGHVNSSWSYFLGGALHNYRINSYGRYSEPDGAGDGSLTVLLGDAGTTFSVVDAREDTGGQKIISGDALAGSGDSTSQASFSAH